HRSDRVASQAAHRDVDQHHVPDARRGDGERLGKVGAAEHDPRRPAAVDGKIVEETDLVTPGGAEADHDQCTRPWASGTPITSRRSSSERTSSTSCTLSLGTSTSTDIERMPRELPSSTRRTTASGTSSTALASSDSSAAGEVCQSSTVAPGATDSATVASTG